MTVLFSFLYPNKEIESNSTHMVKYGIFDGLFHIEIQFLIIFHLPKTVDMFFVFLFELMEPKTKMAKVTIYPIKSVNLLTFTDFYIRWSRIVDVDFFSLQFFCFWQTFENKYRNHFTLWCDLINESVINAWDVFKIFVLLDCAKVLSV